MSYKDKFYSQHKSLTFDDVLIQPTERSDVESRLDVSLESKLSKNTNIKTPILASPMDRVVNFDVAWIMEQAGAAACFHRFQKTEAQEAEIKGFTTITNGNPPKNVVAAISSKIENPEELERINRLSEYCNVFIIDTAMGTNIKVLKAIEFVKNRFPNIDVIAGNIVSPEGCQTLIDAGADGIRAGIGNGSGCLTRIQTGVGRGQLSVLIECADVCKKHEVSLICDGGMSKPGDAAKALAAGADIVMMGSPLAGHNESPGDVFYKYKNHYFEGDYEVYLEGVGPKKARDIAGLQQYKQYRGMASREAQEDFFGGLKEGTTHEGIQKHLKLKGPLEATLTNYIGGIRSAMTYVNASTLEEFHQNAKFEKLSFGSLKESYDR